MKIVLLFSSAHYCTVGIQVRLLFPLRYVRLLLGGRLPIFQLQPQAADQGRAKYGNPFLHAQHHCSFLQAAKCPLQEARDCQIEATRLEPNHQTAKED
jgi:hypothetical protein